MKTRLPVVRLFLISFLLCPFSYTYAQIMTDYCQTPPIVNAAIDPNILFVVDVSGSMGWKAYSYGDSDANADGILDKYNPAVSYEGYFTPGKYYKLDANGVYIETAGGGTPCTTTCVSWACRSYDRGGCIRGAHGCTSWGGGSWGGGGGEWACCDRETTSGDCGLNSGNYLNYVSMSRIDLLRWAMTGGTPDSCTGSQTFNTGYCDPEVWNEPGNATAVGAVCNNTLDVNGDGLADGGCILRTYSGERVKVPWSRVNESLVFKFKPLQGLRPRMGAMFYSDSTIRAKKVYVGDFTAAGSTNGNFPFMNFITHINSSDPSGATPTGPALWDVLNYFSQKSPEYGGFSVQSGSADRWKNPMYECDSSGSNCNLLPCVNNFVILMSDGQWNRGGGPPASSACSINTGFENHSADPVVPAYKMHMGFQNVQSGKDTAVTALYTLGLFLGGTGEQSMKNVAMYGSFDKTAQTWPGNLSGYPNDSCTMDDCGNGRGSGCEPLPPTSTDWDWNRNNVPDTFFKADNASMIKTTIMDAILEILRRTASGTASSALASGEGSGANLVQAAFYPRRKFYDSMISWTGSLKNLWFYVDPFFVNSAIREDSHQDSILNLSDDNVIKFRYDTTLQTTVADVCSDPLCSTVTQTKSFESANNLWDSGYRLWERDPDSRDIFTTTDGSSKTDFRPGNGALTTLLQAPNQNAADRIISFVRGKDFKSCSNAVATACKRDADCPVGGTCVSSRFCSKTVATSCTSDTGCPAGETCISFRNRTVGIDVNSNGAIDAGETNAWKFGDVLNSTPKVASWIPQNTYHKIYNDDSYGPVGQDPLSNDPADPTHFITTSAYKSRGMVFAGGNDGMLHAFKLGKLELNWTGQGDSQKAWLKNLDVSRPLGHEVWAFIPRNALPYLKYTADPDYCHINTVDLAPFIFDASINGNPDDPKTANSWRTILIGGMRLGGACRNMNASCTDCVKTPINGEGFSSYFALDITDQETPRILWEFSNDNLGFATSGPTVVRIAEKDADGNPKNNSNGNWYVVFGSGPTGPIDVATSQFLGRSNQNLKLFVLDLKTGAPVKTIDTGIATAFAGSMTGSSLDTDPDYQDDVIYVPYVKKAGDGTWTSGGVGRLLTGNKLPPTWKWSTVIDNIGPVTSGVAKLQNKKGGKLWLYFGTGRYYFKAPSAPDDPTGQRVLYGIKDPCFSQSGFAATCPPLGGLTNATTAPAANAPEPANGWYINLEGSGNFTYPEGNPIKQVQKAYGSERVITDTVATTSGIVFFVTYKPYTDSCSVGGKSFIWAAKYNSGGAGGAALKGKAMLQVSTGSTEQKDLADAFKQNPQTNPDSKGDRRTGAIEGAPPTGGGLLLQSMPPPVKSVIHMKER